jgi:hypothetical protein
MDPIPVIARRLAVVMPMAGRSRMHVSRDDADVSGDGGQGHGHHEQPRKGTVGSHARASVLTRSRACQSS